MRCTTCGGRLEVLETRESAPGLRRRRECDGCGRRVTTVELAYEGRAPVAVLTDVQLGTMQDLLERMSTFLEAVQPSVADRPAVEAFPHATA